MQCIYSTTELQPKYLNLHTASNHIEAVKHKHSSYPVRTVSVEELLNLNIVRNILMVVDAWAEP